MTEIDRSAMKPLICSLDLEFNQPSKKIIQIGAVIGDLTTGQVVDRFSIFINPGEALAPEIVKLCGIKQADVDSAPDIKEAYRQLTIWLKPYGGQRSLNPLTWGGGDSEDLRQAVGLDREDRAAWVFGRRWTDVKTVFIAWRTAHQRPGDGGLAKSMTKLGLAFQGRRHSALADAENTFAVYVALLNQFQPALVPVLEMPKALGRHRAS
jgi:inhibitor of KinA sporulation pathway (predicted exonuclease)